MVKNLYIYGEVHGSEIVNHTEFEIWNDFYLRGFRHLFMELPYFYAQFINMWMKLENDFILEELFADSKDVSGNSVYAFEFYKKIKQNCSETIFHGTDIGHSFETTGKRYIDMISHDSEEFHTACENIRQAHEFYDKNKNCPEPGYSDAEGIREKAMAENFIRELDSVNDENIMGIYGEAHVFSEGVYSFGIEQNMLSLAEKHYKNKICIHKALVRDIIKPISKSKSVILGKEYDVSYFGGLYTPWDEEADYITFSKIENAFSDFENSTKKENIIPASMYPFSVSEKDVFIIESFKNNLSVIKQIFICDDFSEEYGLITTEIDMSI